MILLEAQKRGRKKKLITHRTISLIKKKAQEEEQKFAIIKL